MLYVRKCLPTMAGKQFVDNELLPNRKENIFNYAIPNTPKKMTGQHFDGDTATS